MDTFTYLAGFSTLILGLAIAKVLQGFADLTEQRARVKWDWLTVFWMAGLVELCALQWWLILRWRDFDGWTFGHFYFLLIQPSILFYLSSLIMPRVDGDGPIDLRRHFSLIHRPFFALYALHLTLDMVDTALKGTDYFASFGPSYPILVTTQAGLAISAAVITSRSWHVAYSIIAALGILMSATFGVLTL